MPFDTQSISVDESGKVQLGSFLILLLDDGSLRIWNDNADSRMMISPRTGNSVDVITIPYTNSRA